MKFHTTLNDSKNIAFGSMLSKFEVLYNKAEKYRESIISYNRDVDKSNPWYEYFIRPETSNPYSIRDIINIEVTTCKVFKNFVLSSEKKVEYDKCRALKKVPCINKLIAKFTEDDQYELIQDSTKSLLNHIDEKGHVYYAIANGLESSNLKGLPEGLIGYIFHYVDGDINMNLTENNAFLLSNLTGELALEFNGSVTLN